jgi:hypothetical protein
MFKNNKRKLTLKQMYHYLFRGCTEFKKTNATHDIEDKRNRSCNKHAVKHTVDCWRSQWK